MPFLAAALMWSQLLNGAWWKGVGTPSQNLHCKFQSNYYRQCNGYYIQPTAAIQPCPIQWYHPRPLDPGATHQPFSRSLVGKSRSLFSLSPLIREKRSWLCSSRYVLPVLGLSPFTPCSSAQSVIRSLYKPTRVLFTWFHLLT